MVLLVKTVISTAKNNCEIDLTHYLKQYILGVGHSNLFAHRCHINTIL